MKRPIQESEEFSEPNFFLSLMREVSVLFKQDQLESVKLKAYCGSFNRFYRVLHSNSEKRSCVKSIKCEKRAALLSGSGPLKNVFSG